MNENKTAKQIAEAYARLVWEDKNLKAIDEFLHPKCVIHSLLGEFYGPGAMKKVVQTWLIGFPDMVVKNSAVIAEKDLVVIQWQAKASHKGEFKGIQPTGRPISYGGATIYRVDGAKIVEYWAYLDMRHLLQQIS